MPEWQWLVGGVAPRDEVMAEVIATRNQFLLIGFALVGGFAVLFLIAVRRLVSRPLDEAAKASERLRGGRPERTCSRMAIATAPTKSAA